ncbi:hypothetical protein OQA88_10757 [Cercophora sp. LCS_1]
MSFRYNTTIRGTSSALGLRDHGRDLLCRLREDREDPEAELTPIIFIGHSIGGMIVKSALNIALREKTGFRSVLEACQGIVRMFFATPQYGMDSAAWPDFVKHVLRCNAPRPGAFPTRKMLTEMESNVSSLLKVSEDFKPLQKKLSFVTFLEDKPIQGLQHVLVSKAHGLIHDAYSEQHQMITGDHLRLCKFRSDEKELFDATVPALVEWLLGEEPNTMSRVGSLGRRALLLLCPHEFHNFVMDREPTDGTCSWIIKKPDFQNWLGNDPGKQKLLIQGEKTGGKSFLARHIIKTLEAEQLKEVSFCFLSESVPGRHDIEALLRATLRQALNHSADPVMRHIIPHFKISRSRDPNEEEIWTREFLLSIWPKVMAEVLTRCSVIFVVDGFDEMGGQCQAKFLHCLQECEKLKPTPILLRVLIITQRGSLLDPSYGFETLTVTPEETINDIAATTSAMLSKIRNCLPQDDVGTADALNAVRDDIVERSNGNYLLTTLVLDILIRKRFTSGAHLLESLEQLPRDLDGLYGHCIKKASSISQNRSLLQQVLRWTLYQKARLKVAEFDFAQALGMAIEEQPESTVTLEQLNRFMQGNIKIKVDCCCGQLVKFQEDQLGFVHGTFKSYLMSGESGLYETLGLHKEHAHAAIARACIAYLNLPAFDNSGGPLESGKQIDWETKVRERVKHNPFAKYAALNWYKHVVDAGPSWQSSPPMALELKKRLEDRTTEQAKCWMEIWWYFTRGADDEYRGLHPDKLVERYTAKNATTPATQDVPPGLVIAPAPSESETSDTEVRTPSSEVQMTLSPFEPLLEPEVITGSIGELVESSKAQETFVGINDLLNAQPQPLSAVLGPQMFNATLPETTNSILVGSMEPKNAVLGETASHTVAETLGNAENKAQASQLVFSNKVDVGKVEVLPQIAGQPSTISLHRIIGSADAEKTQQREQSSGSSPSHGQDRTNEKSPIDRSTTPAQAPTSSHLVEATKPSSELGQSIGAKSTPPAASPPATEPPKSQDPTNPNSDTDIHHFSHPSANNYRQRGRWERTQQELKLHVGVKKERQPDSNKPTQEGTTSKVSPTPVPTPATAPLPPSTLASPEPDSGDTKVKKTGWWKRVKAAGKHLIQEVKTR